MINYAVHPTAIVDAGAQIGEGTRIWHWVHICSKAKIGKYCSFGQNVFVGNDVIIGNNCKVQNNVSIYDAVRLEEDVFCGPSMVFTNVYNPLLAELEAYAPLTSMDSYCVVFDTFIENMFPERSWGPGNNPKTAVREYLKRHPEFEIDKSIQNKLLVTSAPDGYIRKIG